MQISRKEQQIICFSAISIFSLVATPVYYVWKLSRPILTHRRVLSPHLKQKLYSHNLFHARCTKITSCVSALSAMTKIILITNVSFIICFDGTTNYLTPCLLFPKILTFMFEILIILSYDFCFPANLFFLYI